MNGSWPCCPHTQPAAQRSVLEHGQERGVGDDAIGVVDEGDMVGFTPPAPVRGSRDHA